jgi:hypothetical protein
MMDPQEVKAVIIKELPSILKTDPEVRALVRDLTEGRFADKETTEDRFDQTLDEIRRGREVETERWRQLAQERAAQREEDNRRWDEHNREQAKLLDDQARRWDEHNQEQAELLADQARRWDEQAARWQEQSRRWEENQKTINEILVSLKRLDQRHDSTIGALGARWGLYSEQSFRNALGGILEEYFHVQVLNIVDFDDSGEVFGRPDQVELDIVISNGLLIICEIKSSMSRSDVHIFERKARFYEKRHNRTATRLMIVSPMVDPKAKILAKTLGITVYSYPEDVDPATFA